MAALDIGSSAPRLLSAETLEWAADDAWQAGCAATADLLGLTPSKVRALGAHALKPLAADIRSFLISAVSENGGHLGSNLGVVELTLALHRRFESPRDQIVWDTGHQTYVHKILTGRAADFPTLRRPHGLSGYANRGESVHDLVENSHASTALSYAYGLARARDLAQATHHVVAVVGDGALTGGLAYEALSNIGAHGSQGDHHPQRQRAVLCPDGLDP